MYIHICINLSSSSSSASTGSVSKSAQRVASHSASCVCTTNAVSQSFLASAKSVRHATVISSIVSIISGNSKSSVSLRSSRAPCSVACCSALSLSSTSYGFRVAAAGVSTASARNLSRNASTPVSNALTSSAILFVSRSTGPLMVSRTADSFCLVASHTLVSSSRSALVSATLGSRAC